MITAIVVAVVSSPFLILIAKSLRLDWRPSWDLAAIMLLSLDVGTSDTPLVGPYSRLGWNHPGPLLFFVLAPFVRLFGANGLLIGAALIGAASLLVGILVVARCLDRTSAGVATLAAMLLCIGLTPDGIIDPWNPVVAVLPFFAFVLSAWADLCTRRRMAAISALVLGSLVVQAHVGYAPLVFAMWSIEILVRIVDRWRTPRERRPPWTARLRAMRVPLGVGLLLWLPPLYEELRSAPGNLSSLVAYFSQQNEPIYGYWNAARTMSMMLSPRLPWITGRDQIPPIGILDQGSIIPGLVIVLAVLVLGAASYRRGNRQLSTLCFLDITLIVVGWFTLARIAGTPFAHLARWARVIGAFTWMTLLLGGFWVVSLAIDAISARRGLAKAPAHDRLTTVWSVFSAGGAAVAGIVLATMAFGLHPPAPNRATVLENLTTQATPRLRHPDTYLIRWPDPNNFDPFTVGLLAALESENYQVYFPRGARIVGQNRIRSIDEVDHELKVIGSDRPCGSNVASEWTAIACTNGTAPDAPARSYVLLMRETG